MKQPEATFKKQLNEAFAEVFPLGWYGFVKTLAKDGTPDLHYQIGHAAVWVEAKVGDNPLSTAQEREIRRLLVAGARVRELWLYRHKNNPWQVVIRQLAPGPTTATLRLKAQAVFDWTSRATPRFWGSIFTP